MIEMINRIIGPLKNDKVGNLTNQPFYQPAFKYDRPNSKIPHERIVREEGILRIPTAFWSGPEHIAL
ncbi:hypothetical protein D4R75_05605 [bacterium]|nr:MAG: hypothetical protein D4R75_05605 [bacterium]